MALLLAVGWIGIQRSVEYKKKPLRILELADSLSVLQNEICQRRAPIPAAFLRCSKAFEGMRPFYQLLYAGTQTDQAFLTVWQYAVERLDILAGEEHHTLLALGEQIGRYDAQTQETAFCICIEALRTYAQQIRTISRVNARLSTFGGMVCGLLLAIMCY